MYKRILKTSLIIIISLIEIFLVGFWTLDASSTSSTGQIESTSDAKPSDKFSLIISPVRMRLISDSELRILNERIDHPATQRCVSQFLLYSSWTEVYARAMELECYRLLVWSMYNLSPENKETLLESIASKSLEFTPTTRSKCVFEMYALLVRWCCKEDVRLQLISRLQTYLNTLFEPTASLLKQDLLLLIQEKSARWFCWGLVDDVAVVPCVAAAAPKDT